MKTILHLSTLCCCAFIHCSPPAHMAHPKTQEDTITPSVKNNQKETPDSESKQDIVDSYDLLNPHILPSEWKGHDFVLLRINKGLSSNGHHLYTSRLLNNQTAPPETTIETDRHRLKHMPFAGRYVTVRETEKTQDDEWLVTFELDTLNLRLFAKTRRGVIEGIAPANDLIKARDFFLGDTIYSRKRRISIYDSLSGSFSSKRVSVLTPLTVIDVVWGTTPLPAKPIWIMVSTPDNFEGFIPIHFSTTNTVSGTEPSELLWQSDILNENPRSYYDWDPYVWEVIDKHNIFMGMITDQVLLSWGTPDSIKQQEHHDYWHYNNSTLTFRGDTLVESTP